MKWPSPAKSPRSVIVTAWRSAAALLQRRTGRWASDRILSSLSF